MKKEYKKPMIVLESFNLSQSIAAGCGAIHDSTLGSPNQSSKETCAWVVGGYNVFLNDTNICTIKIGENDDSLGVCYNNPNGGTSIFNS